MQIGYTFALVFYVVIVCPRPPSEVVCRIKNLKVSSDSCLSLMILGQPVDAAIDMQSKDIFHPEIK